MSVIYHITAVSEWREAQQKGYYESEALKSQGFIPCCEEHQIPDILKRYFSHKTALIKLCIETAKLSSRLIYNWSNTIEDTFPHIYGPVNLDAIIDATPL